MQITGVILGLLAVTMMLSPEWFGDPWLFAVEGLRPTKAGWIVAIIALGFLRAGRR